MAMQVSFDVDDHKVTATSAGRFNWLSLDAYISGDQPSTYVSLYFREVETIDRMIAALETLKTTLIHSEEKAS